MKDASVIVSELLRMNGYDSEDLILGSSMNGEGLISLIEMKVITYPIDLDIIKERMDLDRTSLCIIADGINIHIFRKDGVTITEVDRLPSKGLPDKVDTKSDLIRFRLRSIMDSIYCYTYASEATADIMVVLAMALVADEKDMWDDLETRPLEVWDFCLDAASEYLIGSRILVDKYRGESAQLKYLTPLLRLRDLRISEPSMSVAKAILSTITSHANSGIYIHSEEICRLLLSLSFGRTEYNGIGTIMMGIESTGSGRQVDLLAFYEPFYGLLSRIAGIKNTFTVVDRYPETVYDTILTSPNLGSRIMDVDKRFFSITSESIAVESALSRISANGRVCALIPSGFLFSKRDERLRDMILNNYHISAIIELKRPFAYFGANMYLIVLDSCGVGKAVISRAPLEVSDYTTESIVSALNGNVDDKSFIMIEQKSIGNIWTPSTIIAKQAITDDNDSGIPISEVAEIIRGCNIPSSKYHPDGSMTGIPYLRISNINNGIIDLTDAKKVSSQEGKVFSKEGDVVISIQGTVGKIATSGERVFIPSAQVALIRPNQGIDTKDLVSSLNSEYFKKQLNANITGAVIKGLSIKSLMNLKVILNNYKNNSVDGGEEGDL